MRSSGQLNLGTLRVKVCGASPVEGVIFSSILRSVASAAPMLCNVTGAATRGGKDDCVNVSGVHLTPEGNFPGSTRCGGNLNKTAAQLIGLSSFRLEKEARSENLGQFNTSRAWRSLSTPPQVSLYGKVACTTSGKRMPRIKGSTSGSELDESNICVTNN